jgi:hypothetical protein
MPGLKKHDIPLEAKQLAPVKNAITRLERVTNEHGYEVQVRGSTGDKISIGQRTDTVTYGSLSRCKSISKRPKILAPHSNRYF